MAHHAKKTDRTWRHHLTGESAPLYELRRESVAYGDERQAEVTQLEDGSFAYLWEDATGEQGLFRRAVAVDAGGNVWEERTSPEDTAGILGTTHGIHVRLGCRDRVGYVRPEKVASRRPGM